MDFDFQRVLLYGVVLGVIAYLIYARYIKNKKSDDKPVESAPVCPVAIVSDKEEASKEE